MGPQASANPFLVADVLSRAPDAVASLISAVGHDSPREPRLLRPYEASRVLWVMLETPLAGAPGPASESASASAPASAGGRAGLVPLYRVALRGGLVPAALARLEGIHVTLQALPGRGLSEEQRHRVVMQMQDFETACAASIASLLKCAPSVSPDTMPPFFSHPDAAAATKQSL